MAVKERGIIMTGDSVRAILDGRKSMTRRVIRPQPQENWVDWLFKHHGNYIFDRNGEPQLWLCDDNGKEIKFPYGKPGDRLWVKEAWAPISPDENWRPIKECNIEYRADTPHAKYPGEWPEEEARGNDEAPKWRPSIFMPRFASRILLEITNVRVEQIQNISEVDAIAEGVWTAAPELMVSEMKKNHIGAYRQLWDSINLSRGFGWDTNCYVWAIEFRRITP